VGNVGTAEVNDFTALGDTINTRSSSPGPSRRPGEVIVIETAFVAVAERWAGAEIRRVEVKGKAEALTVRVLPPD
jgi:hypothetical protein